MDELRRLWREHREAEYPDGYRDKDVAGPIAWTGLHPVENLSALRLVLVFRDQPLVAKRL
jgi:hypothetical protein